MAIIGRLMNSELIFFIIQQDRCGGPPGYCGVFTGMVVAAAGNCTAGNA